MHDLLWSCQVWISNFFHQSFFARMFDDHQQYLPTRDCVLDDYRCNPKDRLVFESICFSCLVGWLLRLAPCRNRTDDRTFAESSLTTWLKVRQGKSGMVGVEPNLLFTVLIDQAHFLMITWKNHALFVHYVFGRRFLLVIGRIFFLLFTAMEFSRMVILVERAVLP